MDVGSLLSAEKLTYFNNLPESFVENRFVWSIVFKVGWLGFLIPTSGFCQVFIELHRCRGGRLTDVLYLLHFWDSDQQLEVAQTSCRVSAFRVNSFLFQLIHCLPRSTKQRKSMQSSAIRSLGVDALPG